MEAEVMRRRCRMRLVVLLVLAALLRVGLAIAAAPTTEPSFNPEDVKAVAKLVRPLVEEMNTLAEKLATGLDHDAYHAALDRFLRNYYAVDAKLEPRLKAPVLFQHLFEGVDTFRTLDEVWH